MMRNFHMETVCKLFWRMYSSNYSILITFKAHLLHISCLWRVRYPFCVLKIIIITKKYNFMCINVNNSPLSFISVIKHSKNKIIINKANNLVSPVSRSLTWLTSENVCRRNMARVFFSKQHALLTQCFSIKNTLTYTCHSHTHTHAKWK